MIVAFSFNFDSFRSLHMLASIRCVRYSYSRKVLELYST
jgi:hypothetical protein